MYVNLFINTMNVESSEIVLQIELCAAAVKLFN
jgi:hypothetical protein